MVNRSSIDGVIELAGPHITDGMLAKLQSHYKALKFEKGQTVRLDLRKLRPKDQERVALDISFYSQNPYLPLESLCAGLDNYVPKNDSQSD